jgi:hypothetical protein
MNSRKKKNEAKKEVVGCVRLFVTVTNTSEKPFKRKKLLFWLMLSEVSA